MQNHSRHTDLLEPARATANVAEAECALGEDHRSGIKWSLLPATAVITCVLCATAPSASAQLYKWVDSGGVVNYGDWPPAGVKVQPVTGGTLSSVADRALVGSPARAPDTSRSAPRSAGPAVNVRNNVLQSNAPASPDDANVVGGYAPYYPYTWRPAVAAEAERRLGSVPVARPMLPIDPAIPDMPLRPRR